MYVCLHVCMYLCNVLFCIGTTPWWFWVLLDARNPPSPKWEQAPHSLPGHLWPNGWSDLIRNSMEWLQHHFRDMTYVGLIQDNTLHVCICIHTCLCLWTCMHFKNINTHMFICSKAHAAEFMVFFWGGFLASTTIALVNFHNCACFCRGNQY